VGTSRGERPSDLSSEVVHHRIRPPAIGDFKVLPVARPGQVEAELRSKEKGISFRKVHACSSTGREDAIFGETKKMTWISRLISSTLTRSPGVDSGGSVKQQSSPSISTFPAHLTNVASFRFLIHSFRFPLISYHIHLILFRHAGLLPAYGGAFPHSSSYQNGDRPYTPSKDSTQISDSSIVLEQRPKAPNGLVRDSAIETRFYDLSELPGSDALHRRVRAE